VVQTIQDILNSNACACEILVLIEKYFYKYKGELIKQIDLVHILSYAIMGAGLSAHMPFSEFEEQLQWVIDTYKELILNRISSKMHEKIQDKDKEE
jgi:hypothetical protein